MKLFLPLSLAFCLAACALTPEDREAAHQRRLWEEARANFLSQGGRERPPLTPAPNPAPQLEPFLQKQTAAAGGANPAPSSGMPGRSKPTPKPKVARKTGDTVYYWQVRPPQTNSGRYSTAELKYAHFLAKRPEDLTPEERLWAREHY